MESDRSLFVSLPFTTPNRGPTSTSSSPSVSSYSQPVTTGFYNKGQDMPNYWEMIPDGVKEQAATAATNFVKEKVSDAINSRTGSRSEGTPNVSSAGRRHSSGYTLSKAPDPMPINLDTGIVPNTYSSTYVETEEGVCSPLHLTAIKIQFPTYASTQLYDYFLNVLAFDIQTKAQGNVGFNMNINTDFSADKILTAMNALVDALQVYFFYMSLISYHSDPRNQNEGMITLRKTMNTAMFENLSLLGRRLADTPVPPNLYQFIRYMSGNFFSGDNQGSPILKTVPHQMNGLTVLDNTQIQSAFTALTLPANNGVYTLMRRAVPQWAPKTLYDVPATPVYDKNFNTIFANLPYINWTTVQEQFPNVTASSNVIQYNTYTNTLDGLAYACCGVYNINTASWRPGLITPPMGTASSTFSPTRRSFYSVGGVKGFYQASDYSFLVRARPETYYNPTPTTSASGHLPGTDKCLNVTSATILETSYKALDYLMSAGTIKSAAKQSGFNNSSSPGGGPKKFKRDSRKGKSKGRRLSD